MCRHQHVGQSTLISFFFYYFNYLCTIFTGWIAWKWIFFPINNEHDDDDDDKNYRKWLTTFSDVLAWV